jgi:HD-GYP domain-containing protein (c-di-GMP phosphodiesterase class II)
MTHEAAINELKKGSGKSLPKIVDIFINFLVKKQTIRMDKALYL